MKAGRIIAATLAVASAPALAHAACSVVQKDVDGNGSQDVLVLGDARRQQIVITDRPSSYTVQIDCDGNGLFNDPGDVTVNGTVPAEIFDVRGGGQDTITYQGGGTALVGAYRQLLITLGASGPGNLVDIIPPPLTSSSLSIDITGSPREDVVEIALGGVTDSAVNVHADLGAGDDEFFLFPGPATRSSYVADVALGSGNNRYGTYNFGAYASSVFQTTLEGGSVASQTDSVDFRVDSALTASRALFVGNLQGGRDSAQIGFTSLPVDGEIYARIAGGDGDDSLVCGTNASPVRVDGRVDIALDGGAGDDLVAMDARGLLSGNGRTRIRLFGNDGNDVVGGSMAADSSATVPALDLVFSGGRGADTVFPSISDPSRRASFLSRGGVQLLGGWDKDLCLTFGDAPFDESYCDVTS